MQATKSVYQTEQDPKPIRQRRRRDQRVENPPRMVETDRVREIVKAVYDHRVMTQKQIQLLFFGPNPGARSRTARTLAKCFDNHYLERHFVPTRGGLPTSTAIYSIGRRGSMLLRNRYGIEPKWYASGRNLRTEFLEHSIAITDVQLAVEQSCQSHGYALTWIGETELKSDYDRVTLKVNDQEKSVAVIPDGYFIIERLDKNSEKKVTRFALEVDRGTEHQARFKTKTEAYIEYTRPGGKHESRYASKALRVLTVTLGERRLANLKMTAASAGGENRFWFALLSDIQRPDTDILTSRIWQIARKTSWESLLEEA
jgi:hypothetical protein